MPRKSCNGMGIGVFQILTDIDNGDPAVIAKRAEDLGFASYWVPEHAVIPEMAVDRTALDQPVGVRLVCNSLRVGSCGRVQQVSSLDRAAAGFLEAGQHVLENLVEPRRVSRRGGREQQQSQEPTGGRIHPLDLIREIRHLPAEAPEPKLST